MKNGCHISYAYGEESYYLSAGLLEGAQLKDRAENIRRDNFTVLYCFDGGGSYEDENGNSCRIKPGTLIQRFPGVGHSILRDQDGQWLEFYIVISRKLYDLISQTGVIDESVIIEKKHSDIALEQAKALIQKIVTFESQRNPAAALAVVQLFLSTFCRKSLVDSQDPDQQKIDMACEIISSNPELPLSGQQLAEKVGMGYHSFRSKFRKVTGSSPNAYRIQKRVDKASEMLLNTDMSIKEISITLGFCDSAAFSHQFHAITGMRPSSFRDG